MQSGVDLDSHPLYSPSPSLSELSLESSQDISQISLSPTQRSSESLLSASDAPRLLEFVFSLASRLWYHLTGIEWEDVYLDVLCAILPIYGPFILLFAAINHSQLLDACQILVLVSVAHFVFVRTQKSLLGWLDDQQVSLVQLVAWLSAFASSTCLLFGTPITLWQESLDTSRLITLRPPLHTQMRFTKLCLLTAGAQIALKSMRMQLKFVLSMVLGGHRSLLCRWLHIVECVGRLYEQVVVVSPWLIYCASFPLVWAFLAIASYLTISIIQIWPKIKGTVRSIEMLREEQNQEGDLSNDICGICQEEVSAERIRLPCGHRYCSGCILKWLEREAICPTCRTVVEDLSGLAIYGHGVTDPHLHPMGICLCQINAIHINNVDSLQINFHLHYNISIAHHYEL